MTRNSKPNGVQFQKKQAVLSLRTALSQEQTKETHCLGRQEAARLTSSPATNVWLSNA